MNATPHIHFVTGRLAEASLREVVAPLAAELGFHYTVDVLPITVAALMTTEWVARHLDRVAAATRVVLPGYCTGDLAPLASRAGVPVERGPRDLYGLPEYLGGAAGPPAGYGEYAIEILAEINHAPRLSRASVLELARQLARDGADVIDLGCDTDQVWSGVGDCVRALRDAGLRVSIDSFQPREIEAAVRAGAELVLSVNSTNRAAAADWGCEVVAVPDEPATLAGLDETLDWLRDARVPFRIDPVLEPIGCGFTASLRRYIELRARYPLERMLMGIGNLTEMTDADSAPLNVVLLAICAELRIDSVLTTEVINWARTSVRECDRARRLVHFAVRRGVAAKHLEPQLVMLRDVRLAPRGADYLARLVGQIRDANYRLFAEEGQLHLVSRGLHLSAADPFLLFDKLLATAPRNLDASHAFYLGFELAKGLLALQLGKQYEQDEALDWGLLTVAEPSHRARRSERDRETARDANLGARGGDAVRPDVAGVREPIAAAERPAGPAEFSDTNPPRMAAPGGSRATVGPGSERSPALVCELLPPPDPQRAFRALAHRPHCLLLESALRHEQLGRYSFLTADPFDYLQFPADGQDHLASLSERLRPLAVPSLPGLPPFQGGAAGLLGYDLGRSLERLPAPARDEFRVPALAMGLYDVVLAWDHVAGRAWIVSQGWPEPDPQGRARRAAQRLSEFRAWLETAGPEPPAVPTPAALPAVSAERLAPLFPVPGPAGLVSNFSADGYQAAVQQVIDYILAGDIFQANLSQRLLYPARDDSVTLYLRLRQRNPATFAGYFDLGAYQIVSASPERFLQVRGGQVEARPIKGTRPRTDRPEADLYAGDDLLQSDKDRAENIMIVDLLRNDLSRVCDPDSVRVTQLCGLEMYQHVQHLVSAVRGRLAPGQTAVDLVRAAFPGGSITGAPKVRAMEIIAQLEPAARGAYCGSLGYLGGDGAMDLSILIRTITAGAGWWQLPVGGGIVARSHPAREYEETWHKAVGLVRALTPDDPWPTGERGSVGSGDREPHGEP